MHTFMRTIQLGFFALTSFASQANAVTTAFVEYEFDYQAKFETSPAQTELSKQAAFYPNVAHYFEPKSPIQRNHATSVYRAFTDRYSSARPILINFEKNVPWALECAINAGARIVSFSIESNFYGNIYGTWYQWDAFESLMKRHPEVLFIVATPHAPGATLSLQAQGRYPAITALKEGFSNVVLAGCLEPDQNASSGWRVDNLRTGNAPILFMKNCNEIGIKYDRYFGGTSFAAPSLAAYFSKKMDAELQKNGSVSARDLIAQAMAELPKGRGDEVFSCAESPKPCSASEKKKLISRDVQLFE